MRKDDFRDYVLEQLSDLRGVDCEAVYSGYGFWCDKTFFAIVSKGKLYFRVNDDTRPDFVAARSGPLRSGGGRYMHEFLEVPAAVLKDAALAVEWATKSITGARVDKKGRRRKVRVR